MDYNNREDKRSGSVWDEWISDEALGLGFDGRELKRESSRVHLSIFLYLIITYAVVFGVSIVLAIALPYENYLSVMGDGAFNITLSIVAQYLIGFPLLIVIMRLLSKPQAPVKEKMKFSELAVLTLIAEALMLVGSIVGNYLSQIIGKLFGIMPTNSLDEMLDGTPIWLMIVSVVILAPIVEEIIFRKMIIDRLSRFGGTIAVIISSVAFALIHTNLYQFPYALAVGFVLGYVYLRSGNVIYTIVIHMIMNFLGSVAILPVEDASEKLTEMLELIAAGTAINTGEYVVSMLIVSIYSVIQTALIVGGIAALIIYARRKRREYGGELLPNAKQSLGAAYINVGAILFVLLCLILTGATFF
ncbi:MAG: CPBP family intramembrane metalloprotease [Clostridia bacterium]|nr:CPBP family intramembrane metalloprotease [Clostridia bacterium]